MKNSGLTEEDFALLKRMADRYGLEIIRKEDVPPGKESEYEELVDIDIASAWGLRPAHRKNTKEEPFKMTDKEKEIEELTEFIMGFDGMEIDVMPPEAKRMAEQFLHAGYRKEDKVRRETARQVYGKICAIIAEASTDGEFIDGDGYDYLATGLREIAKEYDVEEKEK